MCLTPRGGGRAERRAPGPARAHPHRGADRRRRLPDLAEEAGEVAREVVERAAGRHDVDEAEQRGLQLRVLGGELHRLLVGRLQRVARRARQRGGELAADREQLLLERALLDHRADDTLGLMRIAVAADERTGVADAVVEELRRRGHEPLPHGALSDAERDDWAWASEAAARDVADGRAEQARRVLLDRHRRLDRRQQGARHPRRAVRRRRHRGRRAQVERRQRARAVAAHDLARAARGDPRRVVRGRARRPRRTTAPTSGMWTRSAGRDGP